MKIVLASDHAGFALKQEIKKYLTDNGYDIEDVGTHSEKSCDYPVFGRAAAQKVADGSCAKGILVCGTGVGIGITANKTKGIRCANVSDVFSARMSRVHNDANMLAVGARVVGTGLALEIVTAWLAAGFEGGRHQTRVNLIENV